MLLRGNYDRILLVIAHPDDEVMFFGPLLIECGKRETSLSILCLSNGNAEGLGRIRTEELYKCGESFGISSSNITIINHVSLEDGMTTIWPTEVVENIVYDFFKKNSFTKVFTFDEYGVSGHPNHIATFLGTQQALKRLQLDNSTIKGYKLRSRSLIRKFCGLLEILLVILLRSEKNYIINWKPWKVFTGMHYHRSQFVWFRQFFVLFSIYSYINSYCEI